MFNKEIRKKIVLLRKKANLTQAEIAKRMRIKSASGRSFIAQLETGRIKNPSVRTLFDYLSACGASWAEFVKEVETTYNKTRRKCIISQVKLPSNWKLQKKIDRDVTLYTNKIAGVPKIDVKINTKLVKEKIRKKMLNFLSVHKTPDNLIPVYLDYTWHLFKRELNPNPNSPLVNTPWIKSGIKKIIFSKIYQIVHKTIWTEKKRLIKPKPLSQEKHKKMAIKFAKYRTQIEPIELVVHRLLNQIAIPTNKIFNHERHEKNLSKNVGQDFSPAKTSEIN